MRAIAGFVSVLRQLLALVLLLAGASAIVLVRSGATGPAAVPPPDALRAAAADSMESALSRGGSGISFDVVQTNTLHAKDGGPQIALTAPDDQTKVVGMVDEYQVSAIFSRGGITSDAFWMEMRGSRDPKADFAASDFFARVIERGGTLWRDDGVGWYLTSESPGVGMDPATARLLPGLLRSLDKPAAIEPMALDGRQAPGIRGTSVPAAYPGVIAADGATFTEEAFQVDC